MIQSQWNIDINRIRSRMGELVREKAERITQAVYDGVVSRSPVDTGQFRASWNISEGSPDYSTVDVGGVSGNPINARRKIAKATTDFPIFFITNGKPYAEFLEEGNSKQAPSGMVRVTLAGLK